jgi:hypothetical protein
MCWPFLCFSDSKVHDSIKEYLLIATVILIFIFLYLIGWKRLIFAEFPRQLLNALNLFDIVNARSDQSDPNWFSRYINGSF